jgi:hypothetical protein
MEVKFLHQTLVLESCEEYMFHPINAYHSLTRVSKYLSKLVKLPKLYEKSLADPIMIESQAAQGLINIQDSHDVEAMEIANGNIEGFQSESGLTANELYFITKTAMKNGNTLWLEKIFD